MISVVIPTYKNKDTFIKNLQKNEEFLNSYEIIVVNDDPSESLKKDLEKFKNVTLIENKQNLGFSRSVNTGFAKTSNDIVLLLNNDVILRDSSFEKAAQQFKKNNVLFAISFAQVEKSGTIVGKNIFYWKNGFFYHAPSSNVSFGFNGWAEGGSTLIDKKKYNKLGGLDPLFSPFYWEDVDLSYRAWKSGYKVVFDPAILVDHHHSSTINKYIESDFKETIAARNHFIFIWKNITDKALLLDHILFLPYNLGYFATKRNFTFLKGFFLALLRLPMIIKKRMSTSYTKTDTEVISMLHS